MENIESKMGWVMVVDNSESLMIAIHYIKNAKSGSQNQSRRMKQISQRKRQEKKGKKRELYMGRGDDRRGGV
jgi:hypothetical protein